MILPNRKERRKLAKEMGFFGKNKEKGNEEKSIQTQRSQALGRLIHLRNLTEQRNREKEQNK